VIQQSELAAAITAIASVEKAASNTQWAITQHLEVICAPNCIWMGTQGWSADDPNGNGGDDDPVDLMDDGSGEDTFIVYFSGWERCGQKAVEDDGDNDN